MHCDQGKNCYPTERAARSAISALRSKGECPSLRVYEHDGHFHITKSVTQREKRTAPKYHAPKDFIPSAAKLRRKLAEAAAQIKATEKRLTAAERAYFEELDFVAMETARLFGSVHIPLTVWTLTAGMG